MEVRLLGPTELDIGGECPALGGPRQRAVLVDLALHAGTTVLTAQLVDDLWGHSPPASASHTVEAYVSRLRRLLQTPAGAPPVLRSSGPGYRLDLPRQQVDALYFGQLAAAGRSALDSDDLSEAESLLSSAMALWRGPALADVRDASFATLAAARLDNDRLAVLETLTDVRLRLGRHRELVSELEAAVAADPYRERFHAQLMLALYRSGRQADALAAYRRARGLLARDLGIQPGRELRDLEAAVLGQAPYLDAAIATRPASPSLTMARLDSARPGKDPPAHPTGRHPRRRWAVGVSGVAALTLVIAGLSSVLSPERGHTAVASVGISEVGISDDRVSHSLTLPGEPSSVTTADGSLWVTSPEAHEVFRIDPATRARQSIPVGAGAGAIAASGRDIWVANAQDGTVSRIDSAIDEVVQTVAVGTQPTGIAVGDGIVWVADSSGKAVTAIDATTGHVSFTRSLTITPYGAAFGAGSLWLTSPGSDSVTRLQPHDGPGVQIPVGVGPTAITFGLGSVWVANGLDSTVSRVDPATDAIVATVPVGDGPAALAVAGHSLWVADRLSSTLTRLDAVHDTVSRSIQLPSDPVAVGAMADDVWAATRTAVPAPASGGTLRVVMSEPPISIDPTRGYPNLPFQFFEGTYDSLVTYQQTGGSPGAQLVPDLALTMPIVTGDGTTYSFVLRPGLRYSDGTPVQSQDFRYALERLMTLNPTAASLFSGVVGARSCRSGKPCDLSRGVSVSAGTITFHLTAADPNFLNKLALQCTAPVPSTEPARDVGTHPAPSTGPYLISRYLPGHEVDFARNPFFTEWSAAAEPAGSPSQITWTFGASIPSELAQIKAGTADWTDDPVPDVMGLAAQLPSQVHVNPTFAIEYAAFNTRAAPFDHADVRRAFSLAADRTALVNALGGPTLATPTCQILPPGIPGYQRYCPFTVDARPGGPWIGPDLPAARRLVAKSGTRGMRVIVWAQPSDEATGAFIVSVLRELGYRASKVTPTPAVMARDLNDSRAGVQATDGNWTADYPSASNFFDVFFRCSSFRLADPADTRDGSFFCDPAADHLMDIADRQAVTDPAAADVTWAEVDRRITEAAPWVPLATTTWTDVLSTRLSNYQFNESLGVLLDQMHLRSQPAR